MVKWSAVTEAIGVALNLDKVEGRQQLLACWKESGETDHGQRCVLAHYLADLERNLDGEIAWDERALEEHARLSDGDLCTVGIPSARGMLPSLHLNLGDGYLRRGHVAKAREHLEKAWATADALGEDGYGGMVRDGLDRLRQRVDES